MIQTERLRLRPFDAADYEAAILGDDTLAAHLGTPVAPAWLEFPEVLPLWLQTVRADPTLLPWTAYGYFDRATGRLVGGGGFKGRPTQAGEVEIGYGLAPEVRGRGLAVEAATALVRWAQAQPDVQLVTAHTLAENNPSTGVLQRIGFVRTAELVDPDDGPVWRWELADRLGE